MTKWFKARLLDWLTKPDVKKEDNKQKPLQDNDIKYVNDPISKDQIHITELTNTMFDQDIIMFVIGRDKQGKWVYFAREKFPHETGIV